MSNEAILPSQMSDYEFRRWVELCAFWERDPALKKLMPAKAREAMETAGAKARQAASKTRDFVGDRMPDQIKTAGDVALDAALVPTLHSVLRLLELVNDWVVELTDPESVLEFHRQRGRDVAAIEDLRTLDLEHLDEVTRWMTLRWRSLGAAEGAALGAMAMIPVPVVSSFAAISLDVVVVQALSTAIATRVCYAYSFDARDPQFASMISQMISKSYAAQAPKAAGVKQAGAAFAAAKDRIRWSDKLRQDHRLMAAIEKLLKSIGDGKAVSVRSARMGLPVVSVVLGAGTNQQVLGEISKGAQRYAATRFLAHKYSLDLPGILGTTFRDDTTGEDARSL